MTRDSGTDVTLASRYRYTLPVSVFWSEAEDGLHVEAFAGHGYRTGRPLPDTFKVTAWGGPLQYRYELTVAVQEDHLVCNTITAARLDDGPPVTNARNRPPLQRVIRQAAVLFAGDVSVMPDGSVAVDWPSSEAAKWASEAATRPGQRSRRRKDRARLEQVASAWRQFKGFPDPLATAARSVFCSRSQFHRLLHDALDQGVLDPSEVTTRTKRPERNEQP